jgi:hypothetical protein
MSGGEKVVSPSKIPQSCSIGLDCFSLLGTAWKPAGEAEAGNAGEQPTKE